MEREQRARLATKALAGYTTGPGAPQEATSLALLKTETARAVILVEGISDQIAIETLAVRLGRDLDGEGVAVVPIGGAQAATVFMSKFGPSGQQLAMSGLCDTDGVESFRRGLRIAGVGSLRTSADMANFGFYVCVDDLEDELIRAVGAERVQEVFESQGELAPFRTFQRQREWRSSPIDAQLHRFLRTKSRRGLRYARLLVEAAELDRVPHPLYATLASV